MLSDKNNSMAMGLIFFTASHPFSLLEYYSMCIQSRVNNSGLTLGAICVSEIYLCCPKGQCKVSTFGSGIQLSYNYHLFFPEMLVAVFFVQ